MSRPRKPQSEADPRVTSQTPHAPCEPLPRPHDVPYVDGSVGLDVLHVGGGQAQLAAAALRRADDARGDGVLQGKGAAHGHHELALPHLGRAAQGQRGQRVLWAVRWSEGQSSVAM